MVALVIIAALMVLAGCLSIFTAILFGVRWRKGTKEGERHEEEDEDIHFDFIDLGDRTDRNNDGFRKLSYIPVRRNNRTR